MKENMNDRKIESIIKAYKIWRPDNPDTWLTDCSNVKTTSQAIDLGAKARNLAKKKHGHQKRIPNSTLDSFAVAILDKLDKVENAKSFDELISVIESCRIKGISDLAIYDTAHRIGSFLGQQPQKVYIHRGTRTGAEIFCGKIKGNCITIDKLPKPFQDSDLTAADIEDILCIYKDRLKDCV
jgi:hypothetical protein